MNDKLKIVIASNQITMNLVHGLQELDYWKAPVAVFYHKERCSPLKDIKNVKNCCYSPFSKFHILKLIIINSLRFDLYVPHFKIGNFLKFLRFFASTVNVVDDGLDTFRNKPHNIELKFFKKNFEYITFQYDISVGKWLKNINIKKIVDVKWLYMSSRPKIELNRYSTVLVEAPYVNKVISKKGIPQDNILAIRHANPHKRNAKFTYKNELNGIDISLEESLRNYNGHIVIGATMVLISIFINNLKPKKLTIVFSKKDFENYLPIINTAKLLDTDVEIIDI